MKLEGQGVGINQGKTQENIHDSSEGGHGGAWFNGIGGVTLLHEMEADDPLW